VSLARFAAAVVALALLIPAAPAAAERLIVSISNHRVLVTSSYSGVDLVLFGSIEREQNTPPRRGGYDVVVTVVGPRDSERTRRKSRVFGIWVNTDARTFVNVPSYLAILSSKPIEAIAAPDVLRRLQVGLDHFQLPQRIGPDVADTVKDDPFRRAFIRLKRQHGLYLERENAVTFLTPTLFRADVPMPPNVPFGIYEVDVKVFADGALVGQASSALEVIKHGFEQFVADSAHNFPLLYGLATAMLALLTGWFASVVFRRD
jgi:uncharacterized protein (TIGR02186 family)